jgi:C-terminal processing protease CtpA/Prc
MINNLYLEAELLEKDESNLVSPFSFNCPSTYEGIGIMRNFGGVVTKVAKGWPAWRAGIEPGDVLTPWELPIVNGIMEFQVTRNGKTVTMKLRTELICIR